MEQPMRPPRWGYLYIDRTVGKPLGGPVPAGGRQESCKQALYEAVLWPSDKFNYVLMTTGLASCRLPLQARTTVLLRL